MARLNLNKSSLTKATRQLQTYQRFLPALDLKRKQLMAERAKALTAQRAVQAAIATLRDGVREHLPMLAHADLQLDGLIKRRGVELGEENIVGTRLPVLFRVDLERRDTGFLVRPHWVDPLLDAWSQMLEEQARLAVQQRRVILLEEAVRKVTQRVNLFEKVLIPRTQQHIKTIRIALSDSERSAVVRSKIAKGKRQREGLS